MRLVAPILIGVAPFGVIYGVVALQSGISPVAAMAMSSIVFAGSAQFLLAQLVGSLAPAVIMVGAVFLINLRHALYSASVAPHLAHLPKRWKVLLSYLLTDEAYAAAITSLTAGAGRRHVHWILFGSGLGLWTAWQLSTLAGIQLGSRLPPGLPLDFALPLTFIAIVVPLVNDRLRFIVALVAATAAIALAALPFKLGMLIAAVAGIGAGGFLLRYVRSER